MKFTRLEIAEIVLINSESFADDRGSFQETYQKERFTAAGIAAEFVQDNQSTSVQGVLRGLHYQIRQPQGKLVRVIAGEIYDAAVDLRRSSASFGHCVGNRLSAARPQQLWIPPGFAHGFYVLSQRAEVIYKVSDYYAEQWERTLLWNDPALGIAWPLLEGLPPILSARDAHGKPLAEAETYD